MSTCKCGGRFALCDAVIHEMSPDQEPYEADVHETIPDTDDGYLSLKHGISVGAHVCDTCGALEDDPWIEDPRPKREKPPVTTAGARWPALRSLLVAVSTPGDPMNDKDEDEMLIGRTAKSAAVELQEALTVLDGLLPLKHDQRLLDEICRVLAVKPDAAIGEIRRLQHPEQIHTDRENAPTGAGERR